MTLTTRQIKALDWSIQLLLEMSEDNLHDIEPSEAVDQACDLASMVELLPPDTPLYQRLAPQCEELRREHQVRLDQVLAEEAKKTPANTLVIIGWTGVQTAYLNVPKDEAIRRYMVENTHCDPPTPDMIEEFSFDDEFGTYSSWSKS